MFVFSPVLGHRLLLGVEGYNFAVDRQFETGLSFALALDERTGIHFVNGRSRPLGGEGERHVAIID